MARLGLDSFSYRVHMESRDAFWFLDRVVELGLDGCQFDPMHLEGWNETLIRQIARFCGDNGLYLELGSGGFECDFLARRLELAADVGARVVRTFITGERHRVPDERLREWMGCAIDSFRCLAEVAERVRVPLALENHEDLTSVEIAHILDAVDSPYIRALIDTGNGLPLGEDPVECTRRLVPYVAATHLKDWIVRRRDRAPIRQGCPLGQGDGKVSEVYRLLRGSAPDLPITLELPAIGFDGAPQSAEQEETNVVESIRFVRELEGGLCAPA